MTGYETTLVINITDINDKIYDAAPGESAALAERATRWYSTIRIDSARPPGRRADGCRDRDRSDRDDRGAVAAGNAYESAGDVYFRVRTYADYGRLSRQKLDEV